MKAINLFLIVVFSVFCRFAFGQQTAYDSIISKFIQEVKENNVEKIAERIQYPLSRMYPIPDITSERDFIKRYDQVFDDSLQQLIVRSNIHQDWSDMGWQGIMLLNGVLWLDTDGKITAINYQSNAEKKEWEQLVGSMKAKLYPGLKEFKTPCLVMETNKFRIRIDDLGNGNYRYASWSIDKSQSDKPDLILTNGKIEFQGSGGNHDYIFKKDKYTYICSVTVIGTEESPPAMLKVLKDQQVILKEPALKLEGD